MGEIAEMMLDGTLCATCGVYIKPGSLWFDVDGIQHDYEPNLDIPRYCSLWCVEKGEKC